MYVASHTSQSPNLPLRSCLRRQWSRWLLPPQHQPHQCEWPLQQRCGPRRFWPWQLHCVLHFSQWTFNENQWQSINGLIFADWELSFLVFLETVRTQMGTPSEWQRSHLILYSLVISCRLICQESETTCGRLVEVFMTFSFGTCPCNDSRSCAAHRTPTQAC